MPNKVLLAGDTALRQVCLPANLEDFPDPHEGLLNAMYETMLAENGIGLAANQIGYHFRIFILKEESPRGYTEYINPEILSQTNLVDFEGEGCLSIPGVSATTKRYKSIQLAWFTRDGIRIEGGFTDMRAFAIQHEMDHLNGKLYVDQFGPLKRDLVMTKHRKFLKGL